MAFIFGKRYSSTCDVKDVEDVEDVDTTFPQTSHFSRRIRNFRGLATNKVDVRDYCSVNTDQETTLPVENSMT